MFILDVRKQPLPLFFAEVYTARDAELHSGNWLLPENLPAKWRLLPNSY